MIPALLTLLVNAPTAQATSSSGTGATKTAAGTPAFSSVLAQKKSVAATAANKTTNATPTAAPGATSDIAAQIALLQQNGATTAEIVSTLAAQLTATTAQHLGVTDSDARAKLKAAFANALAPPGDAGGTTAAELAARYANLAQMAPAVATTVMQGQQKRIAGTFSDALVAKEVPAQTTSATSTATSASATLTASRAAVLASTAQAATSATPTNDVTLASTVAAAQAALFPKLMPSGAPAGDGRTATSDRTSVATGGDTAVGRLLTRAVNAADARAAQTPAAPSSTSTSTSGATASTDHTTVAAFVKSLETALGEFGLTDTASNVAASHADAGATAPTATTASIDAGTIVPAIAPPSTSSVAAPSAPAPAAPAPAVDQSAIVDQLVRGAFLTTTADGTSQMRLSLVPETLGDVGITLTVNAGNVTAHVVAATPDAHDAIVAAQPQLVKSLADAGLKLQGFTVDVSGGGFAFSQQQQQSAGGDSGRRTLMGDTEDTEDESSAINAIPSFGPPTLLTTSSGANDFNYLA